MKAFPEFFNATVFENVFVNKKVSINADVNFFIQIQPLKRYMLYE